MSIDHPNGGGADTDLDRTFALAKRLSKEDLGQTFMVFVPIEGSSMKPFMSNDTDAVHNSGPGVVTYFINGCQVNEGYELLEGII